MKSKLFIGLVVSLLLAACARSAIPAATTIQPRATALAGPSLGHISGDSNLSLSFVANVGQTDSAVRFQTHSMAGVIFFTPQALVLSSPAQDNQPSIIKIRFDEANPTPELMGVERLPGVVNYFIGNDPARWRTNLPTYAGIVYQQLYPGIDLRYDGADGALKGTYIVAPGADPTRIRWQYDGAARVWVDEATGDLRVMPGDILPDQGLGLFDPTSDRDAALTAPHPDLLAEKAPVAWQTSHGQRVPVTVRYVLFDQDGRSVAQCSSPSAQLKIGFALGSYDPTLPLTIDPTLLYSTYLGGSAGDVGTGIAVDNAGNVYITGRTQSADFPTVNPLYPNQSGGADAFVTKLDPTGAMIYSTYLGGSLGENDWRSWHTGIAVDAAGNAYITGGTHSTDFLTVNPIQGVHGPTGNADVFVAKLNMAGNALVYSTYLGDSSVDFGRGIAVDSAGNAHVVGEAGSDFPLVNPIYTFPGGGHAFVAKINAPGNALVYSTYLGDNETTAQSVAVDSAGNAYVTGFTNSTNFPTLSAIQGAPGGGSYHDAFVTKFNAAGSGLIYSTYLGGSTTDLGYDITVDSAGNAYVTGQTDSPNFPTANPLQEFGGGRSDAFVAKLNPLGSALVFSTYLGGNNDENYSTNDIGGVTADDAGKAYITGSTCSPDFPTASALQNFISGCYAFITQFNPAGSALVFSTFLGSQSGSGNSAGTDIALDSQGNIHITGHTTSPDFLTMRPAQPAYAGAGDAFVAKIGPQQIFLPLILK